jgi:hypothetical protein
MLEASATSGPLHGSRHRLCIDPSTTLMNVQFQFAPSLYGKLASRWAHTADSWDGIVDHVRFVGRFVPILGASECVAV